MEHATATTRIGVKRGLTRVGVVDLPGGVTVVDRWRADRQVNIYKPRFAVYGGPGRPGKRVFETENLALDEAFRRNDEGLRVLAKVRAFKPGERVRYQRRKRMVEGVVTERYGFLSYDVTCSSPRIGGGSNFDHVHPDALEAVAD